MRRMKIPIRKPWIPYIILIISLLITSLVTLYVLRATEEIDQLRFDSSVSQTQNNINSRIETYISLLRGASGLFAANTEITGDEFASFVKRLQLQERYAGIQGLGYAERVPLDQKNIFISRIINEYPEFKINPDGIRSEYFPIVYFEPQEFHNNSSAIGYDMFSDPIRRKAMVRARDTGLRAASGKVTLMQSTAEKKQAGFIMYLPIYKGAEVPVSIEGKNRNLIGFVFAPFRSDDLLSGIQGKESKLLIDFQAYDGTSTDENSLLHDSRSENSQNKNYHPRYQTRRQIYVAGETWTLTFANDPLFEKISQRGLAPFILLGGILTSMTLFLLSRSQYVARSIAEESASKLRISQKDLKKAIGLRDNFISIASHELKTPVTSLKVYTEVLIRTFLAKGDSKGADYMIKMNKQIDKLTSLIQDLLDVSRLQAGKLAFREEEFSLNNIVKDVVENTLTIAGTHKIIIKGTTNKLVWGDKDRIGQVISNFLTNAIKYSPGSKKVIVYIKEDNDHASVAVQDYGIGIGSEHLKKIFKRFYRVSDTNEQTFPGLGMGLYICYEIIKRHRGEIKVESHKGKGSIFSFILPYYHKSS